MNATAEWVRTLARAGVQLQARGDRLHVEARPGTLTRELKDLLANRKTDLLDHLNDRSQLLEAARIEGLPPELVHRLTPADVTACTDLPETVLRAYLLAVHDSTERQAGRLPASYTARALCHHCGPVWLPAETVAATPHKRGWPVVLGCPWCQVEAGRIPRPPTTCATCRNFQPNSINPEHGLGGCGCDGRARYPAERHTCAAWRPP